MKEFIARLVLSLSVAYLLLGNIAKAKAAEASPALELRAGDHIALVGNALGERMQQANYWETLLHQRFPKHELVVRNLCFPGDEPYERLRSLNFGTPEEHLAKVKADVVLYFFGSMEAFDGAAGLQQFTDDLKRLVEETRAANYSGKGHPRVVLISPIAHENLGDPNVIDGAEHNRQLALYTEAMELAARATGAGFVDLFHPTRQLFEATEENLTLNGLHLTEEGYKRLAPILDAGLFGAEDAPANFPAELRAEIADKNFHWFHSYRAVNGYSIYGTRGEAGSDGTYRNREVMQRERDILAQMAGNRDRRIWAIAQGQQVPEEVDDSNTLPFINPKTNVGGPNDGQAKAGKLGSLEYIPAAEQVKFFRLPPGYEIQLVASEEQFPELAKPVAINFDEHGRLWVSTMPSYPQWKPKTPMADKLLILEDHDHDGRADECKVFADGLHQPTGFEIGRNGVYVAMQPDILFLEDTDGDDRADTRVRQLIGFDTADSHHGLAAFEWGPDGGLYFQEGTFKQSQVETLHGVERMGDAGIWRYDPRTEEFHSYASLAFANPWGHVFDRWGQNFVADASPGYNYWLAPITGYVAYPDKHPGGSRAANLDWGGSKSDKEYPVFIPKRVRPTSGCEIVSSRHFPPEAQGNFLVNNVISDLAVLQHRVREEGSGFVGEEVPPLVLCDHGNFRPVDLQFAPDGSLYIVDWHNALIGHLQHNLRDPSRDHSHGRIWRVTYPSRPLIAPPKIADQPVVALLDLLKEPEDRTRYRARRELAERESAEVIAAAEQWIAALDADGNDYQHQLLEALWIYQTHNVVNQPLLEKLLESPDHRARAAAVRVLSYWLNRVDDPAGLLAARVRDEHPRPRLEAVRACSFFARRGEQKVEPAKAIELVLDVLNYEMDYYLEYTLDETIRVLEDRLAEQSAELAMLTPQQPAVDAPGNVEAVADDELCGVPATAPLVFLDKSPHIVAYQLARLPASRLLLVERSVDNKQSLPVYEAILVRPGVSRQDREEAAAALAKMKNVEDIDVLLAGLAQLTWSYEDQQSVIRQLALLMLNRPAAELAPHAEAFTAASKSENEAVRAVASAGLVSAGQADAAWAAAEQSDQGRLDMLAGIPLIPRKNVRAAQRDRVVACIDSAQPVVVRRAAVETLAAIPERQEENFKLVAPLVARAQLRDAAVGTLLAIGRQYRPAAESQQVVNTLVEYAESTPAAKRTTPQFLDAMQLADELLAVLPVDVARSMRERLREVVVRVVRINTVEEEMRYDTAYFAVEAGRPVQLVLRNEDLMPHNLVICAPGTLRDVAAQAAAMTSALDAAGRQYVPDSSDVLFATRMVESHNQDVQTFSAPKEPGEYPYVCTFPNHWMRMYGVMVVVDDLEAWQANPTEPADPLGNTRQLVRNWTMDDFPADIAPMLQGRQSQIGQLIFKEATCANCHKLAGQGGAVGPELTDVLTRWKGDRQAVLREIIDPSHRVEEKFALYNVVTNDGQIVSGIIIRQNRNELVMVTNPENPQPQTIRRENVADMIKSSTSLMPKGLLDRFTQDEIFELLAYMEAATKGAQASADVSSK